MTFEQDVSNLRAKANSALLNQIVGYYAPPTTSSLGLTSTYCCGQSCPRTKTPAGRKSPMCWTSTRMSCAATSAATTTCVSAGWMHCLGIAYRQSGPENGLFQALDAVRNYIGRVRAQIAWLLAEQDRLALPQLALF